MEYFKAACVKIPLLFSAHVKAKHSTQTEFPCGDHVHPNYKEYQTCHAAAPGEKFKCYECPKVYGTICNLMLHVRMKHPQNAEDVLTKGSHVCDLCKFSFPSALFKYMHLQNCGKTNAQK